jgi:hypothetical protein
LASLLQLRVTEPPSIISPGGLGITNVGLGPSRGTSNMMYIDMNDIKRTFEELRECRTN